MACIAALQSAGVVVQKSLTNLPVCSSSNSRSFAAFTGLRKDPFAATSQASARTVQRRQSGVRASTAVSTKFTTIKPVGDRILVKKEKAQEKTSGGILLPSTAQNKPTSGSVVALGEGKTLPNGKKIEVGIATGSKVIYSRYAGTEVEFQGEEHLILKEEDVIGLLDTDDVKDMKPLGDRVLIKVAAAEEKTQGGIILTDSTKEKPVIGTVAAAGPGPLDEEGNRKGLDLKEGSTVLYSKYAGTEMKGKDDSAYVVMRAQDVLAVLS
eukprot:TRINITY_DN16145_c0_g1_i1.p1 TRINITY_DN16145_c0_g1~~TRINITY_DN16145_c0_g1_i1.p1  ORF type:complete len:267 (-),score=56.01 TRINITY_DN16145_c0_g1_i1:388-1188(-)